VHPHSLSLWFILILSHNLYPGLQNIFLSSRVLDCNVLRIHCSPTCYIARPSHPPRYIRPNIIWRRLHIINFANFYFVAHDKSITVQQLGLADRRFCTRQTTISRRQYRTLNPCWSHTSHYRRMEVFREHMCTGLLPASFPIWMGAQQHELLLLPHWLAALLAPPHYAIPPPLHPLRYSCQNDATWWHVPSGRSSPPTPTVSIAPNNMGGRLHRLGLFPTQQQSSTSPDGTLTLRYSPFAGGPVWDQESKLRGL
jgi:hypothetical protein